MNLFRSVMFIAISALLQNQCLAWSDVGHEVIAEIAWEGLTPATRVRVQELLDVFKPFYPGASSVAVASRWLDDIKYGLGAFDNWHYINIDEKKLGDKSMPMPHSPNVVFGICEAAKTLKGNPKDGRQKSSKDFEKAAMLRFFLHLVGDIHQPLHCGTLRNRHFPDGDLGGNRYLIKVNGMSTNLHLYWDLGLGQFGEVLAKYDPSPVKSKKTDDLVKKIMKEFPKSYFGDRVTDTNFRAWAFSCARLGYRDARAVAENTSPSKEYLAKNHRLVRELVALAGYRLRYLLEGLLGEGKVNLSVCEREN